MMMLVASLSGCLESDGIQEASDIIDEWDGTCHDSCSGCDGGGEGDCTVCPNGSTLVDDDNDGAGECIPDNSNDTNNSTNMTNDSGNETTDGGNETIGSGNETTDGGNETTDGGNETTDGGNETIDVRNWSVVDLNITMVQEGAISNSMCGLILAWAEWDGGGVQADGILRQKISDNRSGDVIDVWSASYEDAAMIVQIQEIKSYAEANSNGSPTPYYILVENGNMSSILDTNAETHSGCEGEMNVGLNALMDDLFGNSNSNSCGDGVIDSNEECDDGNSDDGDGCSSSCTQEDDPNVCEDGEQEERDDGCTYTCSMGQWQQGSCDPPDSDGDGVSDGDDAFPNDANETDDSDGDGVGDNADQCDDTEAGATIGDDGCVVNQAQEHFIDISGMAFSPNSITISVGDTITWTNLDSMSHTATGDNSEFDSGTLGKDQSFSFTFTTTGTYTYHCAFHSGMTATIIVQ